MNTKYFTKIIRNNDVILKIKKKVLISCYSRVTKSHSEKMWTIVSGFFLGGGGEDKKNSLENKFN